jgi:hypothetical protein
VPKFDQKQPTAEPAHEKPAHQEPAGFFNPFAGWLPPPAQSHVPSLQHYVDDDLHAHHDPNADAKAQGTAYGKQLVALRGMTDNKTARYQILNLLDRVDNPTARAEMKKQFHADTGLSLEDFIEHADWEGKRDKAEARALISPERDAVEEKMARMSPEERAELKKQAAEVTATIQPIFGKDSANKDENARKVADALAGKTPEQIEAIRGFVRSSTNQQNGLYELVDRSLSKGNEDEVFAAMQGDPVHTVIVGLYNASGDPKRARELIGRLDATQLQTLKQNMPWMGFLVASMPVQERKEFELRLSGNTAAANADRITSLLQDPKQSWIEDRQRKPDDKYDIAGAMKIEQHAQELYDQRKPENMLRELEQMSPETLKSAREAYDPKQHGGKTWDDMIADRFDAKSVEGQRVAALLRGDKVGDKALELREGMRTHNQDAIEHALANNALASKDPKRHAEGVKEQQELAARVQDMDRVPWLPAEVAKGRTMPQQLDDSYSDFVEGKPIDPRFAGMLDPNAILKRGEREDTSKDQRIATSELLGSGKVSLATEMYRARDSAERRAEILGEVGDNKELAEGKEDYKHKYDKEMLAAPDLDKFEYIARQRQTMDMMHGERRSLEDIEKEYAFEDRDVNEQLIEQTRVEGVRAERTPEQLRHDQHEIYDKQHSDKLEEVEQRREFWGGGIGSQHMWRNTIAAMDAQAPEHHWWDMTPQAPPSKEVEETTHQLDKVATGEQKTAREEKIELAERSAKILTMIGQLGSFAVGGPVGKIIFGTLVNLAGAGLKKSIGGEAVDMKKELKEVGIDTAGEIATAGLSGEFAEAKELKEMEEALAAGRKVEAIGIKEGKELAKEAAARKAIGTAAGKMLTTEAQDKLVKNKSDHDTGVDVIKTGLSKLLPGFFGDKVKEAIGEGSKVQNIVAKGAGTVTEKVTDKAIDAGAERAGSDEEKKKELEKRKAEDAELARAEEERERSRGHTSE